MVAEWLSSWLVEQEDRGSIPGLATWIFRDWLSPASKSRYGWKIAKSTLILKTTNQPILNLLIELIIPSQQRWRGYSNAAVRGWLGEWVREWVGSCVREWVRNALPCGHDSDYSFCPITFKLHMHICHDERTNPIDFGSRGQRSRSTLALCI